MSDRKAPVTKELVFEIAESLAGEGKNPTMAAIRDQIGGSFTTIGPWLKEWKSKDNQPAPIEIPESVSEAMKLATSTIWQSASEIASNRISEARASADDAVEQAQSEADEYKAEVTRLENELQSALDDKRQAIESKERVFRDKAGLELECTRLTSELNMAERTIKTEQERFEKLQAKLDELQRELIEIAKGKP